MLLIFGIEAVSPPRIPSLTGNSPLAVNREAGSFA
jgi:hypothetical protein